MTFLVHDANTVVAAPITTASVTTTTQTTMSVGYDFLTL